jgi:general secretion pathway protein K
MAAPLSGRRLSAHRRAPASQRGFALVTVLWAAMILAVIAASIIATGRTETRLAHTRYASAQLDAVADGAINIAILRMLDPSPAAHPPVDATPFTIEFAGHAVAMTAQDESGKVDINMAQEGLLRRLLVTVGVDGLAAQASPTRSSTGARPRSEGGSMGPRRKITGMPASPTGRATGPSNLSTSCSGLWP